MSNKSNIVSKVWNFAYVLRDDGVSYGVWGTKSRTDFEMKAKAFAIGEIIRE